MKRAILTACILAVPISGCSANAASFYKEFVRQSCLYSRKCAKAQFKDEYDSIKDCTDEQKDEYDEDDFEGDCEDYDKAEGRKCLAYMRTLVRKCDLFDAEDFMDECGEVCGDQPFVPPGSSGGSQDGYDGYDGYPDGTGLWMPPAHELLQSPEGDEDSTDEDE